MSVQVVKSVRVSQAVVSMHIRATEAQEIYQDVFLNVSGLNVLLTISSGLKTPIAEIPTPAFAVPYAAPKHVKTMALVQPIAPKNGYYTKLALPSFVYRPPLASILRCSRIRRSFWDACLAIIGGSH